MIRNASAVRFVASKAFSLAGLFGYVLSRIEGPRAEQISAFMKYIIMTWALLPLAAVDVQPVLTPQPEVELEIPVIAADLSDPVERMKRKLELRLDHIAGRIDDAVAEQQRLSEQISVDRTITLEARSQQQRRDQAWQDLVTQVQGSSDLQARSVDVLDQPPPVHSNRQQRELRARNRLGKVRAWQGLCRSSDVFNTLTREAAITALRELRAFQVNASDGDFHLLAVDDKRHWYYLRTWFAWYLAAHGVDMDVVQPMAYFADFQTAFRVRRWCNQCRLCSMNSTIGRGDRWHLRQFDPPVCGTTSPKPNNV